MWYILDTNGQPVYEPDIGTWTRWFSNSDIDRIVGQERRQVGGVDVTVSTVFLGLDHGCGQGGAPILWETMVFGGEHHREMQRYTSHQAAEAGHLNFVSEVFGPMDDEQESLEAFSARVDRLLADVDQTGIGPSDGTGGGGAA